MDIPENSQKKRIPESEITDLVGVEKKGRPPMPELPVEERVQTFDESELTLTEEEALKESNRCLQCGISCYWQDGQPRYDDEQSVA